MTPVYSVTPAVAQGMIGGTKSFAEFLGANPNMKIYSGAVPASAAAALGSAVLLATLQGAATPIASTSDTGTAGRATWGAIGSATAVASGTASFFRTEDNAATVLDQGDVNTSGAAANFSTVAFTVGSTVTMSSRTNDLPYGP